MSMETLNVIQFIELLIGFLGFTVGLPALVFYKKVKHFQASVRFLICYRKFLYYQFSSGVGTRICFVSNYINIVYNTSGYNCSYKNLQNSSLVLYKKNRKRASSLYFAGIRLS